jgi:hypothetical protein
LFFSSSEYEKEEKGQRSGGNPIKINFVVDSVLSGYGVVDFEIDLG